MSIKGKAYIVGVFEHPTRKADDKSLFQLHAECAKGALADAGLGKNDIDGYFCAAGEAPENGAVGEAPLLAAALRSVAPLGGVTIAASTETRRLEKIIAM